MKVCIAQTLGRDVTVQTMQCLMALNAFDFGPDVQFRYKVADNDALVSRTRSILATWFLDETDCDVMVSIDGDIVFTPEDLIAVCQQAMTYDIVSGAYVTRSRTGTHLTMRPLNGQSMTFGPEAPEVYPIKWASTGFLAVHRRVFEKVAKRKDMPMCHATDKVTLRMRPFYACFAYEDPEAGWIYLSEDYAFCERAREEGFTVYVNPHVRLAHVGTWAYRFEDLLQDPLEPQPMVITRNGPRYEVEALNLNPEMTGLPLERSAA